MPRTNRIVNETSLASKAYQLLLDQLLTKKLVPGMVLKRREIAQQLDMSVAPVLEAIIQLQSDGFLESIPRQGTLVRAVHLQDFRGNLLLREAIECEAARIYGGKLVSEALNLPELAARADASESKPIESLWRAECDFHTALVSLTQCDLLVETFGKVMQRKLFSSLHLFLGGEAFGGGDHRTLLRELQTSNPDRAEALIRMHLRMRKEALFETIG